MSVTVESRSTGITHGRGGRLALVLVALLASVFSVEAEEQDDRKKPASATADLPFEAVAPDVASAARATAVYDFGSADPIAGISNTTEIVIPATGTEGISAPYPLSVVVSGFQGTVGRIAVRLNNLTHSYPNDLMFLLVGPAGQKVMLMANLGGYVPVEGVHLQFEDGAPPVTVSTLVGGTYSPTNNSIWAPAPPAPPRPYSTSLSSFVGLSPNGTWSLYVYDQAGNDVGRLSGFTLLISPRLSNDTSLAIPDCGSPSCPPGPTTPLESSIDVSGLTARIGKVTVSFHITHPSDDNLDISLIGPDSTAVPLVEDRGGPAGTDFGASCGNRTVIDDEATAAIGAGAAPFVGTFRPESPLAAFNGKSGAAANGTWRLRVTDDSMGNIGVLQCWSITISEDDSATLQPPTGLKASAVAGHEVTLRWTAPAAGLAPTSYVIEGGVNPGETLASIATNNAAPIHTFVAPTGSFFVRVRPMSGGTPGPPSNEIPLHVNVAVPPSVPGLLLGAASGSDLALAWHNTFEGGPPRSLILEVSGTFNGSIPLPLAEGVSFGGVPPGTYEIRLRAANDAGVSAPGFTARTGGSADELPLIFTFPATCSGAPRSPSRFLAYRSGSTVYVLWDPPAAGWAPTDYVLNVGGTLAGSVATAARVLRGTVGAGSYHLSVAARNPCGVSPTTPVQIVTVP